MSALPPTEPPMPTPHSERKTSLTCSRFQFLSRDGFQVLMQLFKSLSSDHMYVKFHLSANASMEYLMPEWAMGAEEIRVENAGMVRVVNVEHALQKAACRGSGSVVLKITDAQISENNGTWRVLFSDGVILSVSRTAAAPDAELPINVFSALLFGALDFDSAAAWMPGARILNPDAPFQGIFFPKPLMICDYF